MSSLTPNIYGRDYWRSLEEYADSTEFREWQAKAGEPIDAEQMKLSRRRFMQIMAASMSLAGLTLTGCRRWPEELLVPYANRPEGRAPGTTVYYASQTTRGGVATGLLVEAFDGRPIKIEGHPDHPYSQGATDAWTQASILNMYDPDRSRRVFRGWREAQGDEQQRQRVAGTWDAFQVFAREHFEGRAGEASGTVAVLAEPSDSPSVMAMRARFMEQYPQAQWYEWEPINRDNELAGARLAFNQSVRPKYHFEQAMVIAAFDADPLFSHPAAVRHARDWGKLRQQVDDDFRMSRVYAAEPTFSLIGSVADERLATRASNIPSLVRGLAARLGVSGAGDVELNGSSDFINKLAADLQDHAGESLVIVGPDQPAETHALAWAINEQLNNLGQTITLVEEPGGRERTQLDQITELTERMNGGEIDTLIVLGGNPAYDAPADLAFADAMRQVETTIRLGDYHDETSQVCEWHLPASHYLEAWGDGRAWDGTISVQQPLILPLFGGRSAIEVLATVLGDDETSGYDIVRRVAGELYLADAGDDFERAWRRLLHEGVIEGSAYGEIDTPNVNVVADDATPDAAEGEYEIAFRLDPNVYDGRWANNGWLQELPGPLTKLTWDNAALVSVADAEANGWRQEDVIQLTVAGESMELPVFIMPGQARGAIVVHLGYGRTASGHVGNEVGHNTYALRTSNAMHVAAVEVERGRGRYRLATTQNHHLIDNTGQWAVNKRIGEQAGEGGYLIKDVPLSDYAENPQAMRRGRNGDLPLQLYQPPYGTPPKREGGPVAFNNPHAWGMSIDMNSCIGCNACVVACQAENNVPVVGKDQVLMSREMHWIRIDRYFKGDPKNEQSRTAVVHQPMMCVHCENAPCEQVCPVNAAIHDTEGLNLQVYNRCVGTRYCANNCPYKVRRFNYLDYHAQDVRNTRFPKPWLGIPDDQQRQDRSGTDYDRIRAMQFNPDVTVRMRGVMEKCTYCMQRLSRAKIDAKNQWSKGQRDEPLVQEGEVQTACQQSCPTRAIVFGDLNKEDSAVTREQDKPRSYGVLNPELNTRPRTRYLAKLRNPTEA
ncbi:TAT-variant-translocated molybdopterin oxidoreductase [Phycisphaerales bacterium AB-hyl4]|uniref:TAT-variant-translocated molybdopterin oxidoreductase n=1 Tax=Natronomicrosphaera hydrolytica TaxID=3242702 RepID=A0ABV4U1W6_9BACT